VLPNTKAERLGLREGDQIIQVNEVDFEEIEHAEVGNLLKWYFIK
jgi:C-terminal processing protease CtpA/Prc